MRTNETFPKYPLQDAPPSPLPVMEYVEEQIAGTAGTLWNRVKTAGSQAYEKTGMQLAADVTHDALVFIKNETNWFQ